MSLGWLLLVVAGCCEVVWATTLHRTEGFTRLGWTAISIVAAIASVLTLGLALKHLPLGIGYAVWVSIGICGTTLVAWSLGGERLGPSQMICLVLILVGAVGLKLLTPQGGTP